jgi:hypothetical protein
MGRKAGGTKDGKPTSKSTAARKTKEPKEPPVRRRGRAVLPFTERLAEPPVDELDDDEDGDQEDDGDPAPEEEGEATAADFEEGAQEGIAEGLKEIEARAAAEVAPYARTRYLECDLSADEIGTIRLERESDDEEIEKLLAEQGELEGRLKRLKKRIDGLEEEGREKSKRIRLGKVWRDVECEEREGADEREDSPTKGTAGMVTVRLDTGEMIDFRELRPSERQGRLF